MPDLLNTRADARQLRVALLQGCGDHSCRFQKPIGTGTNGGCRCDLRIQDALDRYAYPAFETFVEILRAFLKNYPENTIVCSNEPDADSGARFTAALRAAMEVLP